MRIVGILSWWDESPSWLATSVSGFARVCDDIVAVDGAYALYPGGRARSRPDQAEAVMQACEAAGAGCTIHRPRDVFWGNEVEKRNLTLRFASALNPDWLLVFDADMHVAQAYPDMIRRELEETECDVATYVMLDGLDLLADEHTRATAETVDLSTEWTIRCRHIYRALPGLAYGPTHYSVSAGEVWLRGASADLIAPALHLDKLLVAHHRRQHRALVRRQSADGYAHARTVAGAEQVDDAELLVQ